MGLWTGRRAGCPQWLMGGSVAGALAVLAVLHLCSDRPAKAVPRMGGAALCLVAVPLLGARGSLWLLSSLGAVMAVQVVVELLGKARVE